MGEVLDNTGLARHFLREEKMITVDCAGRQGCIGEREEKKGPAEI